MCPARGVPLRVAWQTALYGPQGFYRREVPGDHFRTSSTASPGFAEPVIELARRHGLSSVWDVGAGGGELLTAIHRRAPDLELCGVDVRPRPVGLPPPVGWQPELTPACDGLVFANELLDNVACDVVELDAEGRYRSVEVDPLDGIEHLGDHVLADQEGWLNRWWPLMEPGQRAEIGLTREAFWARTCAMNPNGVCVAVDYGHLAAGRPMGGSLSSYRSGTQTPVTFDGDHDITAGVAFDALAAVVGGVPVRQRDLLHDLGISAARPALSRAADDPRGYLRDLSAATQTAELMATGGLGDFYWLVTPAPSPGPRRIRERKSSTQSSSGQVDSTSQVAPASAYSSAGTPSFRVATTSQPGGASPPR
jgi:hypothetical protein